MVRNNFKKSLLIIIVFIVFFSCEKKSNNIVNNKEILNNERTENSYNINNDNNNENNILDENVFSINIKFYDDIEAFEKLRKSMYIIAHDGIRKRLYPLIDSSEIGISSFLYGERVTVVGRSEETVTINGVTDYWYKTYCDEYYEIFYVSYTWIFGGYLSEEFPSNTASTILNSYWQGHPIFNENMSYMFSGNTFNVWYYHGEMEGKGRFILNNETIVFNHLYFIAHHSMEGWVKREITATHTYSLSETELKISKEPMESDKYNPNEYYIFNKYTLDF